jgi:sugar lactone lactonase YvrE
MFVRLFASLVFALAVLGNVPARADGFGIVEPFALLPSGASGPEGIAIGPDKNIYVTTVGFTGTGPAPAPGKIYVFDSHGHLLRTLSVAGSTANLIGLAFHPTTHDLLVIDNGSGKVLKVNRMNGAASTFMTVTGGAGLNALTFDAAGNVYVSDSC